MPCVGLLAVVWLRGGRMEVHGTISGAGSLVQGRKERGNMVALYVQL